MKDELNAGVREMKNNVDNRMKQMDEKIYELKIESDNTKTKLKEQEECMKRMESRIQKQEEDLRRAKFQQLKTNKLQQMEDVQSEGSELAKKLAQRLAMHFPKPPCEPPVIDRIDTEEIDRVKSLNSGANKGSWSKKWDEQLRNDADLSRTIGATSTRREVIEDMRQGYTGNGRPRLEEQTNTAEKTDADIIKKTKNKGMKSLRKWFGDETASEDDSSDTDRNEWGTVERRKKNAMKKKKSIRKKKEKETQTLDKAKHILGIWPINRKDLTNNTEKNFETVKLNAVKELLRKELKFNREELDNLTIQETRMSAKEDGYIYCAFNDVMDI